MRSTPDGSPLPPSSPSWALVYGVPLFQVCRSLYHVCSSDTLWKRLYVKHLEAIPREIHSVAQDVGWKKVFLMARLKRHSSDKSPKKFHVKQKDEKMKEVIYE